jgi:hypothetical protein
MLDQTFRAALEPSSNVSLSPELRVFVQGATAVKEGATYFAAVDDEEHELRLVLDAGDPGTKEVAGSVFVRYCGFEGIACGCEVDANPGDGLTAGETLWPWHSTANCLYPGDVETTEDGQRVVRLQWNQRETLGSLGAQAAAAGFVFPSPEFDVSMQLTPLGDQGCAWCTVGDGNTTTLSTLNITMQPLEDRVMQVRMSHPTESSRDVARSYRCCYVAMI